MGWMGPPPLIPGEDPAAYRRVRSRIADAVKPTDILDWFLAEEIVYQQTDIVRFRKVMATLITQATENSTFTIANIFGLLEGDKPEVVTARAVCSVFGQLEQIDRMVMAKELSRNRAVRELERRCSNQTTRSNHASVGRAEPRLIEQTPGPSSETRAA